MVFIVKKFHYQGLIKGFLQPRFEPIAELRVYIFSNFFFY